MTTAPVTTAPVTTRERPYGLQLAADAGEDVQPEANRFDVDAADTDAYEVVGAGAS